MYALTVFKSRLNQPIFKSKQNDMFFFVSSFQLFVMKSFQLRNILLFLVLLRKYRQDLNVIGLLKNVEYGFYILTSPTNRFNTFVKQIFNRVFYCRDM